MKRLRLEYGTEIPAQSRLVASFLTWRDFNVEKNRFYLLPGARYNHEENRFFLPFFIAFLMISGIIETNSANERSYKNAKYR